MENTEWIDVLERKGIIKKDKIEDPKPDEQQQDRQKDKFANVDDLDEIDEEDERAFIEYRQKRLQELIEQQSKARFGSVLEISRQDWVDEVSKAGEDISVVVHVYQTGLTLCTLINQYLVILAAKFPRTKFIKSLVSLCLPDFPEKNLPAIFVYSNGTLKKQIMGAASFGGNNLKCDELEWIISESGAIKSDLEEDPRKSQVKSSKVFVGVNHDEESDSD